MYLFLISGTPTFPVICHAGTLAVVKIRHWTYLLICTIKPPTNFCRWEISTENRSIGPPATKFRRQISSAISTSRYQSTTTMCSIGNRFVYPHCTCTITCATIQISCCYCCYVIVYRFIVGVPERVALRQRRRLRPDTGRLYKIPFVFMQCS